MKCIRPISFGAVASWAGDSAQFKSWLRQNSMPPFESSDSLFPKLPEFSPRQTRRFTPIARYTARAYLDAMQGCGAEGAVDVVFVSDNGEICILESLIVNLQQGELLSPLDFCNSVHHTATGYLSIATSNRGVSRTVGVSKSSVAAGLLECASLLLGHNSERVMLLFGDEMVPEIFSSAHRGSGYIGAAVLFEAASQSDAAWDLEQIMAMFDIPVDLFSFLREVQVHVG